MSQARVHNFTVSLDGFGTGEGQSLEAPFGHAQDRLESRFRAEAVSSPSGVTHLTFTRR